MKNLSDISVIVPTIVKDLSNKWINQINSYTNNGINVFLSIPKNKNIDEVYKLGFSEKVKIIKSHSIGQVNQRQFAYKFCKSEFIINMDDDIEFSIEKISILFMQFLNLPEKSCIAPIMNLTSNPYNKFKLINFIKNFFIFSELNPKPGSISKSSFPVPCTSKNFLNNEFFKEVDWLPGGVLLLRRKHLIKEKYFHFSGKAYCEDLIHSYLLKNKNLRLYASNLCSFQTSVLSYRDLNISNFVSYLHKDFLIRNYFRKLIKNKKIPFIKAYLFLLISYLLTRMKRLI